MTAAVAARFSDTHEFDALAEPVRRYQVFLESREVRVVWIEAETEQEAIDSVRDYPYDDWKDAEVLDGHCELSVVDDPAWLTYAAYDALGTAGPVDACRYCGAVARTVDETVEFAGHAGDCPMHRHYVDIRAAWLVDPTTGRRTIAGWWPSCSCGAPGLDIPPLADAKSPAMPLILPKRDAYAVLVEHVEGRLRSVHIPAGISEGRRWADIPEADRPTPPAVHAANRPRRAAS